MGELSEPDAIHGVTVRPDLDSMSLFVSIEYDESPTRSDFTDVWLNAGEALDLLHRIAQGIQVLADAEHPEFARIVLDEDWTRFMDTRPGDPS